MRATRFGPYELRLSSRELYKFGTKVKLRPQPFQVLSLLLDRPGDVVTREQLRQQLWPSDTFVDFEHSLNTAIKELRGVLNDSATDARFIETLPKLGYRFIFPVEHGAPNGQPIPVAAAVELEATRHPVLTEPAPTLPTPRALTWTWLSLAAAVVLLLGIVMVVARVGVFRHSASGAASAAIKPRPSIAVLGFKNLSRKPDDEWMSTAMAEMLGAELASGQQIRVIPSENIARMKLDLSLAPTDTYGQETLGKIHNHLGTDMVYIRLLSRTSRWFKHQTQNRSASPGHSHRRNHRGDYRGRNRVRPSPTHLRRRRQFASHSRHRLSVCRRHARSTRILPR